MAKELTDILKAAAEVRDETAMQQNTATRVGGVLTDLAQFVGEAVFAAGMSAKTSAAGVSLLIKYYDADGQPTPFMSGIGGLAHGMSWKKIPSRGNFLPRRGNFLPRRGIFLPRHPVGGNAFNAFTEHPSFLGALIQVYRTPICQFFSPLSFLTPRPFKCASYISRRAPYRVVFFSSSQRAVTEPKKGLNGFRP